MTASAGSEITVCQLGLQPYASVFAAMKDYTESRTEASPDQLWLVQHPPVFTQGQAGKAEHVLMPGDIPVLKVDRGGQVTYHGPGQLVVYTLIDLKRAKLNVRELVCAIEKSLKALLAAYGIQAETRDKAPGVYVGEAKIASLGLRIRRGRSYHGLALNVDVDLEPFQRINPCGYQGLRMTRLKDLLPSGEMPSWQTIETQLINELVAHFSAGRIAPPSWRYQQWQYADWQPPTKNSEKNEREQ
ncbi:MAG: lipoyl(octanoyl) transferase LipB [Gammaproteobacteria bacterium]|nr:lipoyl(octanoyl) transferase LipB [Gammaproteobacteria bacterium]MBQ0841054.1 lipoyl(octanoyl) transferase LipB [Gammaproteobacteria bacterium]